MHRIVRIGWAVALLAMGCGDGATGGEPSPGPTPGPTPAPSAGKVGMPAFLQSDFGRTGNLLPGDGLSYCAPVSMADLLVWLADNGYPELAPPDATKAQALNLVRGLGGLFGTTAFDGTTGDAQEAGMRLYMGLKGFAPDEYEYVLAGPTGEPRPGWEFFRDWNDGSSVVQVNLLWYERGTPPNLNRSIGGHNVALIGLDEAAGTITISNPFPAGDPNPQVQPVSVVESAATPALDGLLKFDRNVSGWDALAILEYAPGLRVLRPPGGTAQPYDLAGRTVIDTRESTLDVLAALRGAGPLVKEGPGVLDLVSVAPGAHAYSGGTVVSSGTLRSRSPGATPLGSGAIAVGPGAIVLAPAGDGDDVSSGLASDSGADLAFGPGASLRLELGAHRRLDVDVGGRRDGATPNLASDEFGTLVLAPSTGALGDEIRLRVNGSGGNLPEVRSGIVLPSILFAGADEDASGGFVGYDVGRGFVPARYSEAPDLQTAGAAAVFDASGSAADQTIVGEVPVFALRIEQGEVRGDVPSVLALGSGEDGSVAGLILNDGVLATGVLELGASRGVIYASRAGGRVTAEIRGASGVTLAGPGRLVLAGAGTYAGGTYVAAGTLDVAATPAGPSPTGSGPVVVHAGAILEGDGRIGGDVVVGPDGVRRGAGRVDGAVTIDAGGTFAGGGEVGGATRVNGTLSAIGDGPFLRFGGDVSFDDDAVLLWSLERLTNDGVPGVDFSYFEVEGTLDLGAGAALLLEFAEGIAPDEDLPFWKEGHEWRIASAARIAAPRAFDGLFQPPFLDGSFEWGTESADGREVLTLRYAPNETDG